MSMHGQNFSEWISPLFFDFSKEGFRMSLGRPCPDLSISIGVFRSEWRRSRLHQDHKSKQMQVKDDSYSAAFSHPLLCTGMIRKANMSFLPKNRC